MRVSVEISLYPLNNQYEEKVIAFIDALKKEEGLEIEVNGMSTQIFGDYEKVMDSLKVHIKKFLDKEKGIFNMKIGKGELKKEFLPEGLS